MKVRLRQLLKAAPPSDVYRADLDGTSVIVKVFPLDWLPRLREAERTYGRVLFVPTVCNCVRVAACGDRAVVILQDLGGVDLRQLLREGPVEPQLALRIGRLIAEGLLAIWTTRAPDGQQAAIIYRDLKPGNVLILKEGDVGFIDLDVALTGGDRPNLTEVGLKPGTREYMAPELWVGPDKANRASDAYALGVLLGELLGGGAFGHTVAERRPHNQKVQDYLDRLDLPGTVGAQAVALVRDLIQYDPGMRPRGESLVERLRRLENALPVASWPDTTVRPSSATDARVGTVLDLDPPAPAPKPLVALEPGPDRVAWALGVGDVVLTLALLLGIYVLAGMPMKVPVAPTPPPGWTWNGDAEQLERGDRVVPVRGQWVPRSGQVGIYIGACSLDGCTPDAGCSCDVGRPDAADVVQLAVHIPRRQPEKPSSLK